LEIPNALPTFANTQTAAHCDMRRELLKQKGWSELGLPISSLSFSESKLKGRTAGFEPATSPLKIECSIQLSYICPYFFILLYVLLSCRGSKNKILQHWLSQ
jgi:hypothetical protein